MIEYSHSDPVTGPLMFEADASVLYTLRGLERLAMTNPCPHPMHGPVAVNKVKVASGVRRFTLWKDETDSFWKIDVEICGLTTSNFGLANEIYHYIPVANDNLAQWAALSAIGRLQPSSTDKTSRCISILQDRACLVCAQAQVRTIVLSQNEYNTRPDNEVEVASKPTLVYILSGFISYDQHQNIES